MTSPCAMKRLCHPHRTSRIKTYGRLHRRFSP